MITSTATTFTRLEYVDGELHDQIFFDQGYNPAKESE